MEENLQTPTQPEAEPAQKDNNKNYTPVVTAVIVAVILIITFVVYENKSSTKQQTEQVSQVIPTPVETQTPVTNTTYKDGTYSVEGDYKIHIGLSSEATKHIAVKITLKDNMVTDSDVTNEADDPISIKMQNEFISGYKQYVIGKEIGTLHLSKVSGSSLTPNGFNDALQKIEAQAKS